MEIHFNDRASKLLIEARTRQSLSLRELARRAGTSHATLIAYEAGRKIPSVATFLRIMHACEFAVDFDLCPRIRWQDGIYRGDELAEVLKLAGQFPAVAARHQNYPIFPKRLSTPEAKVDARPH